MVDSLPLSIELSPVQREILDLIIQDQASIQGPVEPERVILLWSEGASESITAEKLGISEEEVKTLRNRWWAWTARIADAEKKLNKAFNDHVSLIFRIPNEEPPSETASNSSAGGDQTSGANQRNPAEQKELRSATRALIEVLHYNPKVYGIKGATGPKEASLWRLKNSMASGPQNLLWSTVERGRTQLEKVP